MNPHWLNQEQVTEIVGPIVVKRLLGFNAQPSMRHFDDKVEYTSSIKCIVLDNSGCYNLKTLLVYYYQYKDDVNYSVCDDLTDLNWVPHHFELI